MQSVLHYLARASSVEATKGLWECQIQLNGRAQMIREMERFSMTIEDEYRKKHMSNNHGQILAGKIQVIAGGSSGISFGRGKRFVKEAGAHL